MARKTLEDFNYNYQAYADYLESAECMQDDNIDIYGEGNNVYTRRDGDWRKGHGHLVDNSENGKPNWERKAEDDASKDRPWYNKWLKYSEKLNLTSEEVEVLNLLFNNQDLQFNESNKKILLKKKR